jgi:hypothetical protein
MGGILTVCNGNLRNFFKADHLGLIQKKKEK